MTPEAAAAPWGGLAKPARLVAQRENTVFDAVLRSGERVAMRFHRLGYQSDDAIRSELAWTTHLAQAGFPCPRPVPDQHGRALSLTGDVAVSCVSWVDGAPLGTADAPYVASEKGFRMIGALLRQLHDMTGDWAGAQVLDRPSWDLPGLLGDAPLWNRFWENPSLTAAEKAETLGYRERATALLRDLNLPLQLIHADAIQENILAQGAALFLIDFDDSGWGYAPYDLGVALVQQYANPDYPALAKALCAGYGRPDWAELMPAFTALRGMASGGWILSRLDADDPRIRVYAQRMLDTARRAFSD